MPPLLVRYGRHSFAIEIDSSQRQKVIVAKGFKDTPDHPAERRIRSFLQGIVDKELKKIL